MSEKIIRYSGGLAKLFISKQEKGDYIGSILYYEKAGSPTEKEGIILDFHLHSFLASDEKEAIEIAKQWFRDNIDNNFTIA